MPKENEIEIKYKSMGTTESIGVKDSNNKLKEFCEKVVNHYEGDSLRTNSDISDWKSNHRYEIESIKRDFSTYDIVVGELLGINDYSATEKFAALLKYTFNEKGKFESRDNPHELMLYQLQAKWFDSLPLLSYRANKGKIIQQYINVSDITQNVVKWYEFQADMDRAEELLALRTIHYQQQLLSEQASKLEENRLDLRPQANNNFMTIVWNMFHLSVEVKQDSDKSKSLLEKYLSTDNVSNIHDFITDNVISWGGVEFPEVAGKKIKIATINPASYRKSFESRAAKNNRVLDMIEWLSSVSIDNEDNKNLRNALLDFLLNLQSNTENACIKDAIGFATLGVSSLLVGLYEKGKLIKGLTGGKLGPDPSINKIKDAYANYVESKNNPVGYDLVQYYCTGLSLIFDSKIQAISPIVIGTVLETALSSSKK